MHEIDGAAKTSIVFWWEPGGACQSSRVGGRVQLRRKAGKQTDDAEMVMQKR